MAQWCRDQRRLLSRLFGPRRFLCPSNSLYRKLLPRLDAQHIEWTLADWICTTLCAQAEDPIALDGKTMRGARKDDQPAPHLLSFRTHHSQETLLQVALKTAPMMSVMSPFRKIVLAFAPTRVHRSWPPCATWRSPSFTVTGLLRLLRPDGTLLLILVKRFAYCFLEEGPCNNSQALAQTALQMIGHLKASLVDGRRGHDDEQND